MSSIPRSTSNPQEGSSQPNQTDKLLEIAKELDVFKTPGGEFYAQLPINNHKEVWPLRSRYLKDWLIVEFVKQHSQAPNPNSLNAALQVLEAQSRFTTNVREVFIRLGSHEGNIYLDLCNEKWEAIKIDDEGWSVVKTPPVMFRRVNGMLPLPKPERGGDINELKKHVNVSEDHWPLFIGWVVMLFHPEGPYPNLVLQGEQGSAKTSTIRAARGLVDPNVAVTHKQPREDKEMHIKAHNAYILAFDNISSMPQWLSDVFCGLATGSGNGARRLYSDDEQVVFSAKRPCSINGIEEIATAGDLVDRAVIIPLPTIPDAKRKDEKKLNAEYEAARPRMLGALLDIVSAAIRNLPNTHLDELPRMADFALWVTAAEGALGWEKGTFMDAYTGNKKNAREVEVESSPVASAIRYMLQQVKNWEGTCKDLLEIELPKYAAEEARKRPTWPKDAPRLSGALRRVAPALRSQGVSVEFSKSGVRKVTLTLDATNSPQRPALTPLPKPVEKKDDEGLDAKDAKSGLYPLSSLSTQKREEERVGIANTAPTAPTAYKSAPDGGLYMGAMNYTAPEIWTLEEDDEDLEEHPF